MLISIISSLQNSQIVDKQKLHLLSWSIPAFSTSGRRRTVTTMEEDQCQQSPQLLDASHNTSDEARVLDSRTRFNPALFLKIFLIYSSSRTSGWQFPSLFRQCCAGARLNVASRCRLVRQKRWPPWGSSQIFPPLLSFFRMLGSLLRDSASTASMQWLPPTLPGRCIGGKNMLWSNDLEEVPAASSVLIPSAEFNLCLVWLACTVVVICLN